MAFQNLGHPDAGGLVGGIPHGNGLRGSDKTSLIHGFQAARRRVIFRSLPTCEEKSFSQGARFWGFTCQQSPE